ncbi:hypothetical protein [Helcococcus kunzii]|uniref:hypothetical protein n=1 Tax=Helcococcus kunzii TaxID=40091 RepID=UPI0038ACBEDD
MLNITQIRMALEEIDDNSVEAIKLSEVMLDDDKTSISIDLILKPHIDVNMALDDDVNDMESVRKEYLKNK